MVLLSSLHVHPECGHNDEPCHQCLEHSVHDGHIMAPKAHVDCPLCAFQSNTYQAAEAPQMQFHPTIIRLTVENAVPALESCIINDQNTRAPPAAFCV